MPRDENLGSALASTERAPLGVSVVSRLGKCATPCLSQNKAVHTRWTAFCLPRDENLGSALASTERAPLGVSVVSSLGKCATPYLSQNKAVHTRWTAFCFSPFRCAILTLLQSNSLTIRDGICGQIPIPSLRSLRIPPLPPTKPALEKVWVFCLLWINKAPQKLKLLGCFVI